MFELRDGYKLLEVIMPQGTATDDDIYIVGAFNGGEENAVGDPRWRLEKAQQSDVKWGIYLDPSTFVDGKTLADGYYFYSKSQGMERTVRNEDILHYDNPALGARTNVTVTRWAEYFNTPANPDEITHDGYVIYVVDNTGFEQLAMYAWGDAEAFGGWPGMYATGTVAINNVTYKYFDTGEANASLNLNLIFSDNGSSQLNDFNVTLDRDYYLELTSTGVSEFDPNSVVTHDGYTVYVSDLTGWDTLTLYMWGDVNDLNGGWPGMVATGTQVINGVTYTYFDMGEANTGLAENLIFSNNGASQLSDFAFTIDHDVYLEATTKGVKEIDPETYTPDGTVTPDDPVTTYPYNIYVEDLTEWSNIYLYAWGDKEIFGGWPGAAPSDTKVIGGHTFKVFTLEGAGEVEHLIFNNNDGIQFDGPEITLDRDYYFSVNAVGCTEIDPSSLAMLCRIYVEDATSWTNTYLYAWGDKEIFNGWPGALSTGTETVDGIEYKFWEVEGSGETENLIFNNGEGVQFDGPTVTLDRNYFLKITDAGYTAKSSSKPAKGNKRSIKR
jgi:hypothetical protein